MKGMSPIQFGGKMMFFGKQQGSKLMGIKHLALGSKMKEKLPNPKLGTTRVELGPFHAETKQPPC